MRRLFKGLFRGAGADSVPNNLPKIKVGVCAMDKKARSKPMNEILERLTAWGEFELVIFGDEAILNKPTEEWPQVECLLCWHSDGFPLKKAQEYILNKRPFLVNDVFMQDVLLDRRRVYKLLVEKNIPVPTHIIVTRDNLAEGVTDPPGFIEDEDYVEFNGTRIYKPFVEKPASGEDHNIFIYYPHSMGGGVKYLFRKVDDKASRYDPEHSGRVRRDGSYIYEEFLPTGGTDVKVYTVGPRYAHAEARKSPVVDGKVLRSADGKEMRFPVLLSPQEKEISRMVSLAFGQKVCGFDLLRSEKGRSYVCDVNGWSFVKNSPKYYDDAAGILRSIILSALAPHRLNVQPHLPSRVHGKTNPETGSTIVSEDEDGDEEPLVPGMELSEVRHTDKRSHKEELRCVLAVIRHGDRTPKQKLKMIITQEPLLALFHKYKDAKGKQAKLKSPQQLQELLDITRQLVKDFERNMDERDMAAAVAASRESAAAAAAAGGGAGGGGNLASAASSGSVGAAVSMGVSDEEREAAMEMKAKLRIMQTVLESGGHFSGINRKAQIKPIRWGLAQAGSDKAQAQQAAIAAAASSAAGLQRDGHTPTTSLAHLGTAALSGGGVTPAGGSMEMLTGFGGDLSASASVGGLAGAGSNGMPVLEEALLILKWGGVLTHAGRQQAEDLGKIYRMVMYPSGGNGLLRLHSTYRHDLKIYSSDEGRVQTSAAAFTKAMLDLEGNSLTPILVSLVNKDASMLEAFGKGASDDISESKEMLYRAMTYDPEKATQAAAPLGNKLAPHNLMMSPPLSPKISRTNSFAGGAKAASAAGGLSHTNSGANLGLPTQNSVDASALQAGGGSTGGNPTPPALLPLERMLVRLQELKASAREQLAAQKAHAAAAAASAAEHGASPSPSPQAHYPSLSRPSTTHPGHASLSRASTSHLSATLHMPPPKFILDLPEDPLGLLKRLVELMRALETRLRQLVREEGERRTLQQQAAAAAAAAAPPAPAADKKVEGGAERGGPGSAKGGTDGGDSERSGGGAEPSGGKKKGDGERSGGGAEPSGGKKKGDIDPKARGKYSSLSMDPRELVKDDNQPCGGEKMLLMFDRWHKLLRSFYSEKKGRFDISKVPDIYDSAKYDAIHNAHLGLDVLQELYTVAKLLADVVIPCEYGLDGAGKLRIGGKIANELVGKLLVDLASMREESMATATLEPKAHCAPCYDHDDSEVGRMSLQDEAMMKASGRGPHSTISSRGQPAGQEADPESMSGMEEQPETETIHRLCPTYASDINSPLRHVRTRIYFTSESHMHSLVNVLRYCHLGDSVLEPCQGTALTPSGTGGTSSPDLRASAGGAAGAPSPAALAAAAGTAFGSLQSVPSEGAGAGIRSSPILAESGCALLDETTELDYLTQVVFRMYENKMVPVDAPERFRVEVLFSAGANYNPFEIMPLHNNHVLPTLPRATLSKGEGVTLAEMEEKLSPFAQTRKYQPCSYALQYSLRAPPVNSRLGSTAHLGMPSLRSNPSFNANEGVQAAAAAVAAAPTGRADSSKVEESGGGSSSRDQQVPTAPAAASE